MSAAVSGGFHDAVVIVVTNEKISDARSMKSFSDESLQRSIASPSETPNIKT
jgi:hypothetical protein